MQRPAKPFRPVRLRLAPPGRKRKSPEKSGLFLFPALLRSCRNVAKGAAQSPPTTRETRVTTPESARWPYRRVCVTAWRPASSMAAGFARLLHPTARKGRGDRRRQRRTDPSISRRAASPGRVRASVQTGADRPVLEHRNRRVERESGPAAGSPGGVFDNSGGQRLALFGACPTRLQACLAGLVLVSMLRAFLRAIVARIHRDLRETRKIARILIGEPL